MGEEATRTETPKTFWQQLDDPLKRTGLIVGITVGVLTLFTNYVVPNIQIVGLFAQFGCIGFYGYKYIKNRSFLADSFIQYICLYSLVFAFAQGSLFMQKPDAEHHVMGVFWFILAFCWFMFLLVACIEHDLHTRTAIQRISETQSVLLDGYRQLSASLKEDSHTDAELTSLVRTLADFVIKDKDALEALAIAVAKKIGADKFELLGKPPIELPPHEAKLPEASA